uniref:CAS_C domain-containing protein n=1 Tax=Steinernema glaseri TaxID=37863 RepID=A0A1I7YL46_9BILA
MVWCFSSGRVSPPPNPPQRKYFGHFGANCVKNGANESDNDGPAPVEEYATIRRPSQARKTRSREEAEDAVNEAIRNLEMLGNPMTTNNLTMQRKSPTVSTPLSAPPTISLTTTGGDYSSPQSDSPTSSGIVADASDSNEDDNVVSNNVQRSSVASSSSVDPGSLSSDYDNPLPRANFRPTTPTTPTATTTRRASAASNRDINANIENNESNRARSELLHQMSDCLKVIDLNAMKMDRFTAPRAWRQAHILAPNLEHIRDTVAIIVSSLDELVDASARVSVNRSSPKFQELQRVLVPLRSAQALIHRLQDNLESTKWTLASLARAPNTHGNDSLDQFVALIKQLPQDARRLLEWVRQTSSSSMVTFLPLTSRTLYSVRESPNPLYLIPRDGYESSSSSNTKRLSGTSTTSTANSMIDYAPSVSSNAEKRSVTFADEVGTLKKAPTQPEMGVVFEEDDLESVVSERDSIYQDYALVGVDDRLTKKPRIPSTITKEFVRALSADDRQLLEFYVPQIESHTSNLSKAIEDFLAVVGTRPPREFVQRGKLIILEAHKLIYIGDNVAQCLSAQTLSREVRSSADRLCDNLKKCVSATKSAADQYPLVSAIQTMVNSIVAVSHAAQELKLLVSTCTSN